MYVFRVICKRTYKYIYYKQLPNCFVNNNNNYLIKLIPANKIKTPFIVSDTHQKSIVLQNILK